MIEYVKYNTASPTVSDCESSNDFMNNRACCDALTMCRPFRTVPFALIFFVPSCPSGFRQCLVIANSIVGLHLGDNVLDQSRRFN